MAQPPRPDSPGYVNTGKSNVQYAGSGYWNLTDLFGSGGSQLVIPGTPLVTVDLMVAGLNAFMLVTTITGAGGTMSFDYQIIDPETAGTVLATRAISSGVGPQTGLVQTFGAFGQTAAALVGDVFWIMRLRFSAAVANQTITLGLLFAGTR